MNNITDSHGQHWFPVLNADEEPAPPYGLLAVAGVDAEGNFIVTRPTRNSQEGLLVNSSFTIPPGAVGQAHATFPAVAAYDGGHATFAADDDGSTDAFAPLPSQTWGSIAPDEVRNAWKLQPGQNGYYILGGAGYGLVNVVAAPRQTARVKVASLAVELTKLYDGSQINVYAARVEGSFSGLRTPTDCVLTGDSNVLASLTAAFTLNDVGAALEGTGIPSGTTIRGITSASTALMSQNATASGVDLAVEIAPPGPLWADNAVVEWFVALNGAVPVTNWAYDCRLLGVDANGVRIWSAGQMPLAFVKVTSSDSEQATLDDGSKITVWLCSVGLAYASGEWIDGAQSGWYVEVNGNSPTAGIRYRCSLIGQDADGINIWADAAAAAAAVANAWVKVASLASASVQIRGQPSNITVYPAIQEASYYGAFVVGDGALTSGSNVLTSNSANFTFNDIGAIVTNAVLPTGTTIQEVTSDTTAILSNPALSGGSNLTVGIYPQSVRWTDATTACWFAEVNGAQPVPGWRYQCRQIGQDNDGKPVWATSEAPLTFARVATSIASNVTLDDDSTIKAWPCTIGVNYAGGAYGDGSQTGWIVEANGGTLLPQWRYQCRLFGQDKYGGKIFITDLPPLQFVKATSVTGAFVTLEDNSLIFVYPATLGVSYAGGLWIDGTQLVLFVEVNGTVPALGVRYQCRLFGQTKRRQVLGNISSGSAVLTSSTANFTDVDIGVEVSGDGIPAGTIIIGIANSQQATLSQNATASVNGELVTILGKQIWACSEPPKTVIALVDGYGTGPNYSDSAEIQFYVPATNTWYSIENIWLKDGNT